LGTPTKQKSAKEEVLLRKGTEGHYFRRGKPFRRREIGEKGTQGKKITRRKKLTNAL